MNLKAIPLAALAAVSLATPGLVLADSGLFIGGSVGSTTLDESIDGTVFDDNATAFRLVTGYQFGDMLGLEIGYQDFGELDETVDGPIPVQASISADGWTAGATLDLPLGDRFSLFGRAGYFFWDADVVVDGLAVDVPGDENPYFGAGARLNLGSNFSLIGDWSRFELDDLDTDVISIGFQYRFGQ
ncbi:MAG TPA: porin family protein [Woeseiaceae bacterium]|jgi:opacity protein-like surface antigen|nr:porin family protein [Woeseiaceae bacterium]